MKKPADNSSSFRSLGGSSVKEKERTVFIILQGYVNQNELDSLFKIAVSKLALERNQLALETSALAIDAEFLKIFRPTLTSHIKTSAFLKAFYLVDNRKYKEERDFNLFKMSCRSICLYHGVMHDFKILAADIP